MKGVKLQWDMIWIKFKTLYQPKIKAKKDFLHKECENWHKLNSVVNVFQLLAITDFPLDYTVSDFYYDSLRPILGLWALDAAYDHNKVNKIFQSTRANQRNQNT